MQKYEIHNRSIEQFLEEYDGDKFMACFCDPPYGLKFMGKNWDHGVPGKAIWQGIEILLFPGSSLFAFGGTRTFHRLMCNIEDAGFDIRDTIMYLLSQDSKAYGFFESLNDEQRAAFLELVEDNKLLLYSFGSGFPKSLSINKKLDQIEYNKRENKILQLLKEKGYSDITWAE